MYRIKNRACLSGKSEKQALRFLRLAHLLIAIFSCITLILISFLHFGQ